MKKETKKISTNKKNVTTKTEKPKANKPPTSKAVSIKKPLIKENINKNGKIISKTCQGNFNTCINCRSIPYFRIHVHDNKFEISIIHNCKKGQQFTYDLTYNAYINRKINKTHQCQKHNSNAILYCIHCKTWLCNKCQDIHNKIGKGHTLSQSELDIETFCLKHLKEKYVYLCVNCHKNYCNKCIINHKELDHTIIKKEDCDIIIKVRKVIEQCKDIMKHNETIKDIIISLLKDKEKINLIEIEYKKNTKINNEIIAFIESLVSNYEILPFIEYHLYHFLISIQLQEYLFSEEISENDIDNIIPSFINYLSNYHVIRNQIINFYEKKILEWEGRYQIIPLNQNQLILADDESIIFGESKNPKEEEYQEIVRLNEFLSDTPKERDSIVIISLINNEIIIILSMLGGYKLDINNINEVIKFFEFREKNIFPYGVLQNPKNDSQIYIFTQRYIYFFDLNTNQSITTIKRYASNGSFTFSSYYPNNIIIAELNKFFLDSSCDKSGNIYIIDLTSLKTLRKKEIKIDPLASVVCQNGNVIGITDNMEVKFYDYKNLKLLANVELSLVFGYSPYGYLEVLNEGIVICYNSHYLFLIDEFDFNIIYQYYFDDCSYDSQLVGYSDKFSFFGSNVCVINQADQDYLKKIISS